MKIFNNRKKRKKDEKREKKTYNEKNRGYKI